MYTVLQRDYNKAFQEAKHTQHKWFFFFAYVVGLGHLIDCRSHLLMKETPFWILSDSSFFAFSRPALHDSDV
jgi:hypothetical protein